jgi:predicted HTH domain antitoxin
MTVQIQLPEIYFLNRTLQEVEREVKVSVALRMYQQGQVSAGGACEIAGLNRYDFLALCAQQGISAIQYSADDIIKEIANFGK